MAGPVVDLTAAPTLVRRMAPVVNWAVLVSITVGLVLGAMACASVMAAGAPHGAHQAPVPAVHEPHATHHGDVVASPEPGPSSAPDHDGGHASGDAMVAGGHPGMACATAVEFGFPEPSVDVVADSVDAGPASMSTTCSADIDPPVPRSS